MTELSDPDFDADALVSMLTEDVNGETYRRVIEQAVDTQRKKHDSDLWNDYDTAGFRTSDVGARGWELEQLMRTGAVLKASSSNSGAEYRLAVETDDGIKHIHEQVAKCLELAAEGGGGADTADNTAEGGEGLDGVDVAELFTDVVGYEQKKKWYRRTLANQEQVHHLLHGEPGSGKSMFVDSILENVPGAKRVVLSGNSTSAQGMVDILKEQKPPVLVVEEMEKGSKADREALMTLCGSGYIQETKGDGRDGRVIEMDTIVFAVSNDKDAITPPSLVDRFLPLGRFEKYSREEFIEVCESVLPREKDVDEGMARRIADEIYTQLGSASVRDAEDIAGLAETEAEVSELVALMGD